MPELTHDSGVDLFLEDFRFANENELEFLASGQAVVISAGVLEGATGTVVKRAGQDQYLVALAEQDGEIWAKLPASLLRAT